MAGASPRGTSNTNDRGSAEARRERKLWLLSPRAGWGGTGVVVPCYRAGEYCQAHALTYDLMQVDRIRPGVLHGRYTRDNIRPSCQPCNFATGIELRERIRRGEIVIMPLDSDKGSVVLFKEGKEWVGSAARGGCVVAEYRSTNRVTTLGQLSVSLLEEIIKLTTSKENVS